MRKESTLIAELESPDKKVHGKNARHNGDGDERMYQTEPFQSLSGLRESEERYRRLFETAQDGILLLDAETGAITEANPFLIKMLGYAPEELNGKRLWEIGAFVDVKDSKAAFEELQRKEYIRYEDLPLKTKEGQNREVEFVSNVYLVNGKKVIQCNIRDITERKMLEKEKQTLLTNLQEALDHIKELKGLLSICANCKKIRSVDGNWQMLEEYIIGHTDATFTHGMCPDCMELFYPGFKNNYHGKLPGNK